MPRRAQDARPSILRPTPPNPHTAMGSRLARLLLPVLLLVAAALPTAVQAQAAAATVLRGDVNGDGQVTMLDALAVLAYVVGKPLPTSYAVPVTGDADGNGIVSALDALVIAGFAAGHDVARFPVGARMPALRGDAVECAADARSGTLTCGTLRPASAPGMHPMLMGGQGVYIRLTSTNTHFDESTRTFTADVRLSNLLAQMLGLDATGAPDPEGIRVFFNEIHSSAVSVMETDGYDTFLAPNQPYYTFAGPLAPGDSTAVKTWRWHVPEGIDAFSFRVYATGAVQYPGDHTTLADQAREREEGVTLNLVSGGGQTGPAGQPLPQPVVVRVLDVNKQPVADATVEFLPGNGGSAQPRQARTDAAGYARTTWTLGPGAGTQEMRVSGAGGTLVVSASTGAAPGVFHLTTVSGDGQTGAPSSALSSPLVARVTRDGVGPVAGSTVTWRVVSGGGTMQPTTTVSDTAGLVHAAWTLGAATGTQVVRATLAGADSVTFTATAQTPPPPTVTTVRITPDSLVLMPGDTGTFTAASFDQGGAAMAGTATWTTADSSIARVDATGKVTAVSEGTVQVMATIGAASASARVRVTPAPVGPVVRVVVSPDTFIMYPNQRRHFTATAYDAAGHVVNAGYFKWSSSDSNYVKVDLNGYVLALGQGTTTITATVSGVSGSGQVIVPPATSYPMRVTWIERRSVVCCKVLETGPSEFGVNFWMDVSRASSTASLRLRSPAGETTSCTMERTDDYIRRTFTCTLALPANSAPGIWKVDQVVVDGRVVNAAGLDSMDTPGRRLVVFGPPTPDTEPPQVGTVVPEIHGGVYYFKFGMHDFRSNVTRVSAVVRGPSGQRVTCTATASDNDYRTADWLCRLPTVTAGSGRWALESVTTSDAVGNSATYTPEQIEPIRGVFEYTFLWMEFDA
jgi:hypothetical protein